MAAGRNQLAAYWLLCGMKQLLLQVDWTGRDQARLYLATRSRYTYLTPVYDNEHRSFLMELYLTLVQPCCWVVGARAAGWAGWSTPPRPRPFYTSPRPLLLDRPEPTLASRANHASRRFIYLRKSSPVRGWDTVPKANITSSS